LVVVGLGYALMLTKNYVFVLFIFNQSLFRFKLNCLAFCRPRSHKLA
jgi:hypothetical protein